MILYPEKRTANLLRKKANRERFERILKVKLSVGREVSISGSVLDEHIACQVLAALDFGFCLDDALLLKNPLYTFETVNLKEFVRQSRLKAVKGRIIGKAGKAKKVISELADVEIVLKNYSVGILGESSRVFVARNAVEDLARGVPHKRVYRKLEEERAKTKIKV